MGRYYGDMLTGQAATAMTNVLDALNASPLFIINGTMDITSLIVVPSYRVNLEDVYEEWTDSNKLTHRDITAKKAKGNFEMIFQNVDQYQAFMMYLRNNKKQNGSYNCSVYLNNMLEAINTEMYIDFAPENIMPIIGVKEYRNIEVTVEQRGNQYIV